MAIPPSILEDLIGFRDVADDGTDLTRRRRLNFKGVVITDDPANNSITLDVGATTTAGQASKQPVRVRTTANVDLATGGLLTIDGVTLVANDRVLVMNQTAGAENGIYLAATGAWARSADFNESAEITDGTIVAVGEGTAHADTRWQLTTNETITLGATALVFSIASAATLAEVLAVGNSTGASDIDVTSGQAIDYLGEIDLQRQGTPLVSTAAGAVTVTSIDGTGAGAGANTNIGAGTGGATDGAGGKVVVKSGTGGGANGDGGALELRGGIEAGGSGVDGAIELYTGDVLRMVATRFGSFDFHAAGAPISTTGYFNTPNATQFRARDSGDSFDMIVFGTTAGDDVLLGDTAKAGIAAGQVTDDVRISTNGTEWIKVEPLGGTRVGDAAPFALADGRFAAEFAVVRTDPAATPIAVSAYAESTADTTGAFGAAGVSTLAVGNVDSGESNTGSITGGSFSAFRFNGTDAGTLTNLIGGLFEARQSAGVAASALTTNLIAGKFNIGSEQAGATVTNAYGIQVTEGLTGGTVTNYRPIWEEIGKGTNRLTSPTEFGTGSYATSGDIRGPSGFSIKGITITVEAQDGVAGPGGGAVLRSGNGDTNQNGGDTDVNGGIGDGTGNGGTATMRGGAGGATGGATAGLAIVIGGAAQGTNAPAVASVRGGIPTDANGADAELLGSAGVGTNRSGGAAVATGGGATGTGTGGGVTATGGAGGATDGTGGAVNATAGAGGGSAGPGGVAHLTGGAGQGAGAGGEAKLEGGTSASGTPGRARIAGGAGGLFGGNAGGNAEVFGGDGDAGGNVTIAGGTAGGTPNFAGGNVDIDAGGSVGNVTGGTVDIRAGTGGTTGNGGAASLTAGNSGATSGDGGQATVQGGTGETTAGIAVVVGGAAASGSGIAGGTSGCQGGTGDGAGAGGLVAILGGIPGATGTGGAASVKGGDGGSTSGAGGAASLTGGTSKGALAGATATVQGGTGGPTGTGGAAFVRGAAAVGSSGAAGGKTEVLAGAGDGAGVGGLASLIGGDGGATGTGGSTTVSAGDGGGTSGAGGNLSLNGGDATSGAGGTASVTAGSGTTGGGVATLKGGTGTGATGAGGNAAVTGGNSNATNGDGGEVVLTPGDGNGTGEQGVIRHFTETIYREFAEPVSGGATDNVTVFSPNPGVDATYHVDVIATAIDAVANEGASYHRAATFRDISNVTTQIGTTTAIHTAEDDATWDCTVDTSANVIRVNVTGDGTNPTDWTISVKIVRVTDSGG